MVDWSRVSIPQAVSAVATKVLDGSKEQLIFGSSFNTASGKCCCNSKFSYFTEVDESCFNTASGKCCCNCKLLWVCAYMEVSIPQAVSAVATLHIAYVTCFVHMEFQYRKR